MELFPAEIKAFPQWAVADADKKPLVWDNDIGRLMAADVTDPDMLMTFEAAKGCAAHFNKPYIGFVLTAQDPFTCIDLDVKNATNEPDPKKHTTPEQLRRFEQIMTAFDTYTEVSRSGLGVHLWLRGNIGKGRRRDGVEVYSQERFIICTGNPVYNKPVAERDHYLTMLVNEIDLQRKTYEIELVEKDPVEDDATIHQRALEADNGDKYARLFNGEWVEMGFPSQSEADLALISMYAFYTESNEQCRRLFRYSALGKREKANKNNVHIDRCLRMCRGRMERERIAQENVAALARDYAARMQAAHSAMQQVAEMPVTVETTQGQTVVAESTSIDATAIDWPPGLAGELAKYIYKASVRPVKEISIVTALGFMAGVCGKVWQIPQSGLNGYFVLIARSGVGKETLNSGLSNIVSQLQEPFPQIHSFVSFDRCASGSALRKSFADKQSFINLNGEFGKIIKAMATAPAGSPMQSFKNDLTDVYQKSGQMSIVGGMSYSDKANNTEAQQGVAYSIMGETTPDTFFEALTREMMEDGFLSRFHVVRYEGDRPPLNKNQQTTMDQHLRDMVCHLVNHTLVAMAKHQSIEVQFSPDAEALCDQFNDECDRNINATKDEAIRQPWNRAHLKVLRLSALLAVGENWINPVVQTYHVQWALDFVRHGQDIIMKEWHSGGIGTNDEARIRTMCQVCVNYLTKDWVKVKRVDLRKEGIITRGDITTRLASKSAFKNYHHGLSAAIESTIKEMVAMGALVPVTREETIKLGFTGAAWRITQDVEGIMANLGEEE